MIKFKTNFFIRYLVNYVLSSDYGVNTFRKPVIILIDAMITNKYFSIMQKYTYIANVNETRVTLTINISTAVVPLYQVFTNGKLVGCLLKETKDQNLVWSGTTLLIQELALKLGNFIRRTDEFSH
ncbi:hypothetical protein H7F33_07645 [Pedobacter sp. PAMC26386]|nr:hypothetical protein H7F33_07645 [Pedobacter sp. PAMC26386]